MLVWILGIGAMISLFVSHQQKSRKGILVGKLCADLFWAAHYICLGAFAGMIPNFIGIFREVVFINRKKYKFLGKGIIPIVFIITNLTLGIISYEEWFDALPILASAFVTFSLWIDNPKLTKCISIPVSSAFLVYDVFVNSYMGIINESVAILSIIIFFIRKGEKKMFKNDFNTQKELVITQGAPIENINRKITAEVSDEALKKGAAFSNEIAERFVSDFEKQGDKMAHVSTFKVIDSTIYMTYYANTKEPSEDPKNQTARFVYANINDLDNKVFIDLQTTGDRVGDKTIDMVYDSIFMQKDEDTLFVMWTARTADKNYYRFYCPFTISTKTMGEIGVNRFKVGDTVNDLSVSGIKSALAENEIPCKRMYSDIGIMQKQSYRTEDGKSYCYSGLYSGDFTCIIKSCDLITWEYVSQPDFINDSKWENATYVLNNKVYYFVRQQDTNKCGFLTVYDLESKTWETPIEIEDCQSRGDFIFYRGNLYLFHAPVDREHIGIVKIDTDDIANSQVVLQSKMTTSCFYPFVQFFADGELAMSYTVARQHIRLARFDLHKYL